MADRKRRLSTHPEDLRSAKRQASDAHKYSLQSNPQAESSTQGNATRRARDQAHAVARSSPRWNSKLRAAILQAAKSKPRFLFRATCVNSEDLAEFSSHGELVPRMVGQYDETIEAFFSHPLEDMTKMLCRHPACEDYFTKWTPSMFKAIKKALYMRKADGAGYDVHLVVLDTKSLTSKNLTVGRAALQHAFDGYLGDIPASTSSAYLVYGILGQEDFCARPLKALNKKADASSLGYKLQHRPLDILRASLHNTSPTLAIDIAREFAKVFDDDGYALPVTVMAIATLCQDRDSLWSDQEGLSAEIVTALQDLPIQSDWKHDSTITTAETHTFDQAADRGLRLLCALADRRSLERAMRAAPVIATDLDSLADGISQVKLGRETTIHQSLATDDSTSEYEPVSPSSNVPEEYNSFAGDRVKTATDLPPGVMDDETKRSLLEAQRYTPRYLFRGWRNGSSPSGGHKGLNTMIAITPLAYLKNSQPDAPSIYDLNKDQLHDMCQGHLSGYPIETQLSSWASSLQVAWSYSGGFTDSFISIIDTKALENVIIHVPRLAFLGDVYSYPHEYLAHGVISGPAHKAIPATTFKKHGMMPIYPSVISSSGFNPKEVAAAKIVADEYGAMFGTAVLLAVLCTRRPSPDLFRSGIAPSDLALIVSAISEYKVPQRLCSDDTILKDLVYTENYADVEQMIRLLRAVIDWRHGKGARGRRRVTEWDDSASLMSGPPAEAQEDTEME